MKPTLAEIKSVGFCPSDNNEICWHFTGKCGVLLENDKFIPCDMFDNGNVQYADESFDNFVTAAKFSINYFS